MCVTWYLLKTRCVYHHCLPIPVIYLWFNSLRFCIQEAIPWHNAWWKKIKLIKYTQKKLRCPCGQMQTSLGTVVGAPWCSWMSQAVFALGRAQRGATAAAGADEAGPGNVGELPSSGDAPRPWEQPPGHINLHLELLLNGPVAFQRELHHGLVLH